MKIPQPEYVTKSCMTASRPEGAHASRRSVLTGDGLFGKYAPMDERFFSIRMRAARAGSHVSGAERLAAEGRIPALAASLARRAMEHSRGLPDEICLTISAIARQDCLRLPALAASSISCASAAEGRAHALRLLVQLGIGRAEEILALLLNGAGLRGAMLVDSRSLRRLEPDKRRGVRATRMDSDSPPADEQGKDHFREALVLASKVANAPGIVAEICVSDDPDYVTGYVASKSLGYVRIERLKESGSAIGGRVFIYDGEPDRIAECVDFLERQPVLVAGLPPKPEFAGTARKASPHDFIRQGLRRLRGESLERHLPEPCAEGALEMSASDYLGLARHPAVIGAACRAMAEYGACGTGSRLTTGNCPAHELLETALARFCHSEACVLFSSGYAANLGVIQALCGKGDLIFSDELNHASIIDACRLSGATVIVYPHGDMAALDSLCRASAGRRGLVVSDAVFSMDGDIAPMGELAEIAGKNGMLLMLDEAHALGVLDYGMGADSMARTRADVVTGSLSKSLASQGGYARCGRDMANWLLNRARSFIFSTALPAACSAAALAALDILARNPQMPGRLRQKRAFLCRCLLENGVSAQSESAIVPVMIGDEERALRVAAMLKNLGVSASAIRYPTVARGAARLRLALSLAHDDGMLGEAAKAVGLAMATC